MVKKNMKKEPKRLYRSRGDKMIAGVCGGIAEYLNVDPVWIRLAAVVLALMNGIGIILYIIAWILIPENPVQKKAKKTVAEEVAYETRDKAFKKKHKDGHVILGVIILLIGSFILLDNLGIDFDFLWPIALIGLGAYLILRRRK